MSASRAAWISFGRLLTLSGLIQPYPFWQNKFTSKQKPFKKFHSFPVSVVKSKQILKKVAGVLPTACRMFTTAASFRHFAQARRAMRRTSFARHVGGAEVLSTSASFCLQLLSIPPKNIQNQKKIKPGIKNRRSRKARGHICGTRASLDQQ